MPASENQSATSLYGQKQLSRKARPPFRRLGALMFFCLFSASADPAIADTAYWTPWVTSLTTNSAAINWLGAEHADKKYSVEYATKKYYDDNGNTFQTKIESPAQGTYQHVLIAGLEPNTSYVYKVTPPDGPTDFDKIGYFKTMPVSGPFTFLVISDTHAQEAGSNGQRFNILAHAIAKNETDALFILDCGDFASYDLEEGWRFFFNDKHTSEMLAKFPIFHTVGNHEYHQHPLAPPPTQAVLYHDTFNILDGEPLNYSFDCSGIRFVVLDSPDPSAAGETDEDPQPSLPLAQSQALWLKGQLDNNMAGTFTLHHHPKWYSHSKGGNSDLYEIVNNPDLQPWDDLYLKYGISANFTGHVHNYQRFSVKGIPYFIVGNGGGTYNGLATPIPSHVKAASYQFGADKRLGYLKVAVDPENNTATAQEIFVASMGTLEEPTTAFDTPIIADTHTFPLSSKRSSRLTVNKSGGGSGTVASCPPHEIYCDSSTSTYNTIFMKKDTVVLTAVPAADSVFNGWTGDCKSSGRFCYVTIRPGKDASVTAVFEKAH